MRGLTPFDTGDQLEPFRHSMPDREERNWGAIDLDDETDYTVAIVRNGREPDGHYRLEIENLNDDPEQKRITRVVVDGVEWGPKDSTETGGTLVPQDERR